MAFNVNEFRSQMVGDGARPNLFEVSMPFPGFSQPGDAQKKLTFMCKTAQLPGSTVGVVPVQYFGRELKFAGNRTFTDWTVTIINDEDFVIRKRMMGLHFDYRYVSNADVLRGLSRIRGLYIGTYKERLDWQYIEEAIQIIKAKGG